MSDRRLRELERRYRESGTEDDEAAWLAARYRAGEEQAVRAAALVGHPPAARVLVEEGDEAAGSLDAWVDGLAGRRDVLARVLAAALRFACEKHWAGGRFQPVLKALDAWTLCPCRDHWERVGEAIPDEHMAYWRYARSAAPRLFASSEAAAPVGSVTSAIYQVSKWRTGVRAHIRGEVVPWCLGEGDPVRERGGKG